MSFHDVSLPDGFQYTSQSGPGFATVTQETASGHEYRLARQSQGRHRFRLIKAMQTQAEMAALKTFALGRRGALHSFRVKDWADYTSNADGRTAATAADCVLGTGDGSEQQFQLSKTYDVSGADPYVRTITCPVAGTVLVAVAGTPTAAFTLTNPSGIVTMTVAPGIGEVVTAGFEFDVPARFAESVDRWNAIRVDAYQTYSLADFDCVEVLDEVENPELWYPGGGTDWGATSADITLSMSQGELHLVTPGAAINAYLPAPPTLFAGGPRVFVVSVATGSAGSVQLRDSLGVAVGAAIAAGTTRRVGCLVSSGTATWVVY